MVSRLRKPLLALGSPSTFPVCSSHRPLPEWSEQSHPRVLSAETRQDEISRIQRALETEIVKEKLKAYGLTPGEIEQKLAGLSEEQIHLLAQASDQVLAGADDALGVIIVSL